MAAAQARRRSGGAALHQDRARRRLPARRVGGGSAVSLRFRLLAALAYVLVLAIFAFGVPLAINLRARVNAEIRTQAQKEADLIAATAADLLGPANRARL